MGQDSQSSPCSRCRRRSIRVFSAGFLAFFLCLFGFSLHAGWLIRRSFDRKHVHSRPVSLDDLIPLPAITVCSVLDLRSNSSTTGQSLVTVKTSANQPSLILVNSLFTPESSSFSSSLPILSCELLIPSAARKLTQLTGSSLDCRQLAPLIQSVNFMAKRRCFTFLFRLSHSTDFRLLVGDSFASPVIMRVKVQGHSTSELFLHSGDQLRTASQDKSLHLSAGLVYRVHFASRTLLKQSTNCFHYDQQQPSPRSSKRNQRQTIEQQFKELIRLGLSKVTPSSVIQLNSDQTHRSHWQCVSSCLINAYRQYCKCLPLDFNVQQHQLLDTDLFCDDPHCLETIATDQSILMDPKHRLWNECTRKCPEACEQQRFDWKAQVEHDLVELYHSLLQQSLASNDNNGSSHGRSKTARHYYPDGSYYDPHYLANRGVWKPTSGNKMNTSGRPIAHTQPSVSEPFSAHLNKPFSNIAQQSSMLTAPYTEPMPSLDDVSFQVKTTATTLLADKKSSSHSLSSSHQAESTVRMTTNSISSNLIVDEPYENITVGSQVEEAADSSDLEEHANELEAKSSVSKPVASGPQTTAMTSKINLLLDVGSSVLLEEQFETDTGELIQQLLLSFFLWIGVSCFTLIRLMLVFMFGSVRLLGCVCCCRTRQGSIGSQASNLTDVRRNSEETLIKTV